MIQCTNLKNHPIKYIAILNCICYNASRQKVNRISIAKEWSPRQCCSTVEGFFFSFMVAKHSPGYLLSLSFLSSHLQMRWQATPAPTETTKVNSSSIALTSSRCRVSVGQQSNYTTIHPALLLIFVYQCTSAIRLKSHGSFKHAAVWI